jgi:preprotein translocase subunit YajC
MKILSLLVAMLPGIALAQDASAQGNPMTSLLPLIFIFFIFYFLLIRPQQKRFRAHQEMIAALKKGDEVVTGGGIVGTITHVADAEEYVLVQIAAGVEVKVARNTVTSLAVAKPAPTTPAHQQKKANKNDNNLPNKQSVANDN